MEVRGPSVHGRRMAFEVDGRGGRHPVWFELPHEAEVEQVGSGDAALAMALLIAMRWGEDLTIEAPVSSELATGSRTVQDIFCTWDRTLRLRDSDRWYRTVAVDAPVRYEGIGRDARGVAAFFTGGVDSLHVAVTRRDHLDALVYVHGFDVDLGDVRMRDEVSSRLRTLAEALGLPLLEVETNLQEVGTELGVGWPDLHGAALAAVAHLLGERFQRVLIPATHTYAHLEGLGSHPLVDPLWSSDRVRIEHVGADADRIEKVRAVASLPAARAHLRVCWENRGGAYNCGRCEKCVRTGIAIRIAGEEGRFPGVRPPSLGQVLRVRPTGRGSAWSELRDELERTGANPRLRRTIELALARHQLARWRPTRRWFG